MSVLGLKAMRCSFELTLRGRRGGSGIAKSKGRITKDKTDGLPSWGREMPGPLLRPQLILLSPGASAAQKWPHFIAEALLQLTLSAFIISCPDQRFTLTWILFLLKFIPYPPRLLSLKKIWWSHNIFHCVQDKFSTPGAPGWLGH